MVWSLTTWSAHADPLPRFRVTGDGVLHVQRGREVVSVHYRQGDGAYSPEGATQLARLWGVRGHDPMRIEPRLLEALDHLQDHFANRPFVIVSGYRSREQNAGLRRRRLLAAQSSMHIEGGAVDLFFPGLASATVAEYARSLECCGVGYYHGKTIHIDTGPVRFWDEKTSGTEDQTPQRNAKIIARTVYDRYPRDEPVVIRLMRITEFPVVVATEWTLECGRDKTWDRVGRVRIGYRNVSGRCAVLSDPTVAREGMWLQASTDRHCRNKAYRLAIPFCQRTAETMPTEIVTNHFEIGS
ncbi:MAG: YcbK family protein [Deltaproteobacteria bacterium]|nr:YcbK family protein [Deltaproteobacteria bacterium]